MVRLYYEHSSGAAQRRPGQKGTNSGTCQTNVQVAKFGKNPQAYGVNNRY
jgi:hypothetical protein